MAGIIEELQRGALDPTVPVDALLRRLRLAALKLQLPAVESWVQSELNGYERDLPDYRIVRGQLRGFNPFQGWIPVLFQEDDIMEMVSTAHICQSVGTLVDLVANRPTGGSEGLHYPLSPGMVNTLNSVLDYPCPRYIILLSRGNVVGILDRVRNMILDWAIRMEQQGIVGEGITFSAEEKTQAQAAMTTINIGSIENMAGHIGIGNEGMVGATQGVEQSSVFDRLADALAREVGALDDRQRLLRAVQKMNGSQADSATFAEAYGEFIVLAVPHMTLVASFLPALTAYLK